MLSIVLFAFIFLLLLLHGKIDLTIPTAELDCLAIPHILLQCPHPCEVL